MLGKTFLLALIIYPCIVHAQNNTVVKTDTSVIETKYYEELNSIRVFNTLNGQNKIYYTNYYYDTHKINEQGILLNGYYTGIVNTFWPNGKLKLKVDYNNSKIIYADKKAYPFFDYQNAIKLKADDIIKRTYSKAFFEKYVIWDISTSYIYSKASFGNWLDNLAQKPNKFLLRYTVKWNGKHYPELIEFEIDSKGIFVKGSSSKGFEKLPQDSPKTFNLTVDKAIKIAAQKGLIDTGKYKGDSYLAWEANKSTPDAGKFRVYVTKKTASLKDINPNGRSTVIDKYDAYVFNPWSGAFIEKKKMKTVRGWEKESEAAQD